MYGEIMRNAWSDCLIVLFVSVSRYQPVSSISIRRRRGRGRRVCVYAYYILYTHIYIMVYICVLVAGFEG